MRLHTRLEREILSDIFCQFPTGYLVTKEGAFLPEKSGNDIDLLVQDFKIASTYVYELLSRRNEVFEVVTTTNMSRFLIETDSARPLELDIFHHLAKKWIMILDYQSAHVNMNKNGAGINYLCNDSSIALSIVKDYCTYGRVREKNIERSDKLLSRGHFEIIGKAILKNRVYKYYINKKASKFRIFNFVRLSCLFNPIIIFNYVNRNFRTRRMWKDHYSKKSARVL